MCMLASRPRLKANALDARNNLAISYSLTRGAHVSHRQPYTFGETISQEEYEAVVERLVSPESRKRVQRVPFLAALHAEMPNRLEHEINRFRGIAFDSGECGFSHTFIQGA